MDRVPWLINHNHAVCSNQIDPQRACLCAEEKNLQKHMPHLPSSLQQSSPCLIYMTSLFTDVFAFSRIHSELEKSLAICTADAHFKEGGVLKAHRVLQIF